MIYTLVDRSGNNAQKNIWILFPCCSGGRRRRTYSICYPRVVITRGRRWGHVSIISHLCVRYVNHSIWTRCVRPRCVRPPCVRPRHLTFIVGHALRPSDSVLGPKALPNRAHTSPVKYPCGYDFASNTLHLHLVVKALLTLSAVVRIRGLGREVEQHRYKFLVLK